MKKASTEEDSVIITQEVNETAELLKEKLAKESKKITRIPYYKLEELKKIEEKKLKNFHKIKKKEEHVNNHPIKPQTNKIKKSKKQREEEHHYKLQHQQQKSNTDSNTLNNNNNQQQSETSIDKNRKDSSDSFTFLNDTPADIQEDLSPIKKQPTSPRKQGASKRAMRLSKKQQRIQNPTYSLSQFMSYEDKVKLSNMISNNSNSQQNMFNNNNSDLLEYKGNSNSNRQQGRKNSNKDAENKAYGNSNSFFKSAVHKNSFSSNNEMKNQGNAIGDGMDNKNNYNNTGSILEEKEEDLLMKSNSTDCLQKKRKRMTKYKKAIYKYRIKKKQFLYNTVFDKGNNDSKDKIEDMPVINMDNIPSTLNNQKKEEEPEAKKQKDVEMIKEKEDDNVKDTENKGHANQILCNDNINVNDKNINSEQMMMNKTTPVFNYHNHNNNNQFNYSYYYYSSPQEQMSQLTQYQQQPYQYPYNPYMPLTYPYNLNPIPSTSTFPYPTHPNASIHQYFNPNQIIQTDPNNKFSFEYAINANNFYLNPQTNHNNNNTTNPKGQSNILSNWSNQRSTNIQNEKFTFELTNQGQRQGQGQQQQKATEPNITNQPISKEKFKEYLKETYNMDININELNGKDLNDFLQKHKDITKINLNQIQKYLPKNMMEQYLDQFEGLQKSSNKLIREYVDQILDKTLDEKFSLFIEKLRDLYYKKKTLTPLKAKKRFVVGMREIEKFIRLKELLCLFVVPNIEKVTGKNSLDDRLKNIFNLCRSNTIPLFFGLNKFKLGKIARKKVSCISMIGIINVEGFEKELKDLIEYAEKFKEQWYVRYYGRREEYSDNPFIEYSLFEYYKSKRDALEELSVTK